MDKQISHFKILEEIGSGGMGVVYRARDLRLRRTVALKVLPAGALAEPMIRERLMREAQTASALNHPHIVTVFEIHSAGDRDFIAMEFVKGQSLDRLIGDEGLPLEKALRYAIQIADGLSCAHQSGVIHRDLKPQNIMITPSDDVKILDFGLAKRFVPPGVAAAGDASSIAPGLMTLTAPGVKVGTPAYMSPEQIESKQIDARSDVFSFGALLYEMLTGVAPFHRRNAILIFKAVLSDQPELLRTLKPNLSGELEGLLTQALRKDAEERQESMSDVLTVLESVQLDLFGAGISSSRSGVMPVPALPRRGGAWWRVAAPAAGAVVAAAAALWALNRPPAVPVLANDLRVSAFQDSQRQASFSPAGDRLVFIRDDAAGQPQVWTKTLPSGMASQMTPVPFAGERPRWHPVEDRIIVGAHGGGIWSLDLAPGAEPMRLLESGARPQLSAGGDRVVFERDQGVWIAGPDDGEVRRLETVPPAFFSRWVPRSPAFSPDGREVVYFQPESGPVGTLWVASVAGGAPRRLMTDSFRGGDPVWTADGRWIIYWSDQEGGIHLWTVAARGGEAQRLTRGAGRNTEPALSADGSRIVYTTSYPNFALLRRSAATGDDTVVEDIGEEIVRPTVSPAGDRIAFFAPVGPDIHLHTIGVDGDGRRQVTDRPGERNLLPQWSADGEHLYFYQERPSRSFRKVSVSGGASVEILADWSMAGQYDTAVAPEERRVVYTPLAGGVPGKLRVRDLNTGVEQELGAVLQAPRWSADGEQILGSDVENRIYMCPSAGGQCRYLADGFQPRWSATEGRMVFARHAGTAKRDRSLVLSIWTFDLGNGEEKRLVDRIEAFGALGLGYDLLPDGDLVWNQLESVREELWTADLE